jgi:hypothetical protein
LEVISDKPSLITKKVMQIQGQTWGDTCTAWFSYQ